MDEIYDESARPRRWPGRRERRNTLQRICPPASARPRCPLSVNGEIGAIASNTTSGPPSGGGSGRQGASSELIIASLRWVRTSFGIKPGLLLRPPWIATGLPQLCLHVV